MGVLGGGSSTLVPPAAVQRRANEADFESGRLCHAGAFGCSHKALSENKHAFVVRPPPPSAQAFHPDIRRPERCYRPPDPATDTTTATATDTDTDTATVTSSVSVLLSYIHAHTHPPLPLLSRQPPSPPGANFLYPPPPPRRVSPTPLPFRNATSTFVTLSLH